ncbi:hypothetical protein SteCoe_35462 [Stentor coeruleus]|uniref:C2H2-type domain-containing protein n=1 Tax=Stentor coeruleus TaxID=5963 RepID=A0A1R2AS81_9CILI|nr:hypothetical protein SteCoe_35462 [Stentor coeruleus]
MFKCSTFKCLEPPIKQCSICREALFCNKCTIIHKDKHFEEKTQFIFKSIKFNLSKARLTRLRNNIKEFIINIELQKNNIIKEAIKIHKKIDYMIKSAFEQLDFMIKEYFDIYRKNKFKEKDIHKIQEIIKGKSKFEYPLFSDIEGILTKNIIIINHITKSVSRNKIQNEYGLFLEGHTNLVKSVAITNDNQFVIKP